MDTFVRPSGGSAELLLDKFRQVYATFHVLVLYKFKHDVAFRRTRVESLVSFFVVVFNQDYGILALGHFQIFLRPRYTQRIGFRAACLPFAGQGVGVYGDKEVGFSFIGDFRPAVQRDEDIRLPGIDDFHIRAILFYQFAESKGYGEVDILFA